MKFKATSEAPGGTATFLIALEDGTSIPVQLINGEFEIPDDLVEIAKSQLPIAKEAKSGKKSKADGHVDVDEHGDG